MSAVKEYLIMTGSSYLRRILRDAIRALIKKGNTSYEVRQQFK